MFRKLNLRWRLCGAFGWATMFILMGGAAGIWALYRIDRGVSTSSSTLCDTAGQQVRQGDSLMRVYGLLTEIQQITDLDQLADYRRRLEELQADDGIKVALSDVLQGHVEVLNASHQRQELTHQIDQLLEQVSTQVAQARR